MVKVRTSGMKIRIFPICPRISYLLIFRIIFYENRLRFENDAATYVRKNVVAKRIM